MQRPFYQFILVAVFLAAGWPPVAARAEIDGHGPDAWRVHGVASDDVLNARSGPGTSYRVIETFAHDATGLQEITCVPYLTMAHYSALSQAEIDALPPRWCLMRSADMHKAGWVAARYLMPQDATPIAAPGPADDPVAAAQDLVRALYEAADLAGFGAPGPLDPAHAADYFFSDIAAGLATQPPGADPLTGAQDFDGNIADPVPDPDQPMFRGMITIRVPITNFGRTHTALFRLRPDPSQPGAPIRIFRIDHDGWSFPS